MQYIISLSIILTSIPVICDGLNTAGIKRPIVQTNVGELRGFYKVNEFKARRYNINHFRGIRYAKPPIGDLRFMKPEPFVYNEPHEAVEFGSPCPQVHMDGLGEESENEDCLFLNMYLPTDNPETEAGHAVIIFIHGTDFLYGSSSLIPGDILSAAGNVIVVTFNYRLGPFGFLNPGDDTFPENVGLWDQRLAIKWVKDNIDKFAGDPTRITLIGESSGSESVILHGMYPENDGLFQNIVPISGTPFIPPGYIDDNSDSAQYLAELMGCYPTEDRFKSCMQTKNITVMMEALKYSMKNTNSQQKFRFGPNVDGDYIKDDPMKALQLAKDEEIGSVKFLRSLNLVTGVNNAEGGLWIKKMADDIDNMNIDRTDMATKIIPATLSSIEGLYEDIPSVLNDLVLAEYTDWRNITYSRLKYVKLMGDLNFNIPMLELVKAHSESSLNNTWVFKFDTLIPEHVFPTPTWLPTANHGDILYYLFGFSRNFTFGRYKEISDYKPEKWELRLARRIITHISTLAKTGDPNLNQTNIMVKYNTLSKWPAYDATSGNYLSFRNTRRDKIGHYIYAKEYNFWQNIVPRVMSLYTPTLKPLGGFRESNNGDSSVSNREDNDTDRKESVDEIDNVEIIIEDDGVQHTEL